MPLHSDLTGAELHESKGVSSASANTVAVANGSGSTTWQKITTNQIDTTSIPLVTSRFVSAEIPDVSTPNSFCLIPLPSSCVITAIEYVLENAITVADAVITATNPGIGTIATTTIAFTGSAEGTIFNASGLLNTSMIGPKYIKLLSDGGSTTAARLFVTVRFTLS